MANSFKIAEQFVNHIILHRQRGRIAVNQTQLAKDFECSSSALRRWIERLLEAKIINRSPHSGPDGFDYWLTGEAMLVPQWRSVLALALQINVTKSQHFNIGQKFSVINNFLREMKIGIEGELSVLKQTLQNRDGRIKEMEEENSSMRFEMNRMLVRMRELETAYNSMIAINNAKEQKMATVGQNEPKNAMTETAI